MNFHPDALVQLAGMAVDDRLCEADRQRQRRALRRARQDQRHGFVVAREPSRHAVQHDDVATATAERRRLSATL
jgi:hypothetical protein